MHAAFIWRGKRHAEQRRPLLRILGSWGQKCGSKGTARWLSCVVRTGTAWSSLGCWLFILSAVAWPEVGVRSASRTQAAVRQLWGKVACATGVSEAPSAMWHGVGYRSTHTLVIEV